jgi:glycosyltransferase involved in cell wall biosynthesis
MKIAIFSDNFYPEMSGISDSILLLAQNLVQFGHEVHFFAPKYVKKNYALVHLDQSELKFKNITIHRLWSLPLPFSPTKQSRFVIPMALLSKKFRNQHFDVVHVHSPFGVGLEGMLLAKILKIPLVGTNHTPIEEFVPKIPLIGEIMRRIAQKYFVWFYNKCIAITVPYEGLLLDMQSRGLKVSNQTISNPIDIKNFIAVSHDKKRALKNKYALREFTILYTGRLASEKCVDIIIKSFAEIKKNFSEVNLIITGIGSAEQDLKKLTEKLNLQKDVTFFGRVEEGVLIELYQASDIFVIMSKAETQSLSMMKAMSVGMPVIGADAKALPRYIQQNCGFVVPVDDVASLTNRIVFLLENTKQRRELGEKAKMFVAQFEAQVVARKWEHIYKNIGKVHSGGSLKEVNIFT